MPLWAGKIGLLKTEFSKLTKDTSGMKLSHTRAALSASFDDPNLIGSAGLVTAAELMAQIGFGELACGHVRIDGVANVDKKVGSLVLGMIAGADCIEDMDLLRHGGMDRVFTGVRAPSTLGTFLRSFTFGHVRQFEAVSSRAFTKIVDAAPNVLPDLNQWCAVDIDDTMNPVYGVAKQGAQHGYTGFRGLNALIATVTTSESAPMIAGSRLRRGGAHSARGAHKLLADTLATVRRSGASGVILVRADAGFYCHSVIAATTRAGACFSITARLDSSVRRDIAAIPQDAWTRIMYSQAIPDPDTGELVSAAEVTETTHTLGSGKGAKVTARLIVRRVPERNTTKIAAAQAKQGELFTVYRYHAVFTNNPMPMIEAEKTHRAHAIVEQVISDLKSSALAHLPSGKFAANGAWLTSAVIAHNITRALGVLAGTRHQRQETATIRRQLINIPARVAKSGRRITLHLPRSWPWEPGWINIWDKLAPT